MFLSILWMDEILHRYETMGHHCSLVFTGEPSVQGVLGGAGFRPSTVWLWLKNRNSKMACPGKSKHGPRPAACPSCLILSHTHIWRSLRCTVDARNIGSTPTILNLKTMVNHSRIQGFPVPLQYVGHPATMCANPVLFCVVSLGFDLLTATKQT